MSAWKRRTKRTLIGLGIALCVALVVGIGAALWLTHTSSGRARIASLASDWVSAQIRGRLHIGSVLSVGWNEVHAKNVWLIDLDGKVVIKLADVHLSYSVDDIQKGFIHFPKGTGRGGSVWLRRSVRTDGAVTLIEALEPRITTVGGPAAHASVDEIELQDVIIRGDVLTVDGLRTGPTRATGKLTVDERGLTIAIAELQTRVTSPLPYPLRLNATQMIVTSDDNGTRFSAPTIILGSDDLRVEARVQITAPSEVTPTVTFAATAEGVQPLHLAAFGWDWANRLAGPLRATVDGTWNGDLHTRIDATGPGGRAKITLGATEPQTLVQLETEALDLAAATSMDLPEASITGKATLTIPSNCTTTDCTGFAVDVEPFSIAGLQLPALHVDGALGESQTRLDHIDARHLGGTVAGSGRLHGEGSTREAGALELNLTLSGLQHLERDPNLRGQVGDLQTGASGQVKLLIVPGPDDVAVGPGDDASSGALEVNGDVRFARVRYGNITSPVVRVSGRATIAEGVPQSARLTVLARDVTVAGTNIGELALRVNGRSHEAKLSLHGRALGRQWLALNAGLQTTPQLAITQAEGTLGTEKRSWVLSLTRAAVHPSETGSELKITGFTLRSGIQRFALDGNIGGAIPSLRATAQQIDLSIPRSILGEQVPALEGELDVNLEIKGTRAAPHVSCQGAVRHGAYRPDSLLGKGDDAVYRRALEDWGGVFAFSLDGEHAELDSELTWKDATLAVTGLASVPTLTNGSSWLERMKAASFQLQADASDFDISNLGEGLPSGMPLSGRASGRIDASGTLSGVRYEATASIERLAWDRRGMMMADLHATGTETTADLSVKLSDEEGPLGEIAATVPINAARVGTTTRQWLRGQTDAPFLISARTEPRATSSWPAPFNRLAPVPLTLAGAFTAHGGNGLPLEANLQANVSIAANTVQRYCPAGHGFVASIEASARGDTTQANVSIHDGSTRVFSGNLTATTPFEQWSGGQTPLSSLRVNAQGALTEIELSSIPFACRIAQGRIGGEFSATNLLSPTPAVNVSLRSNGLVLEGLPALDASFEAVGTRDKPLDLHLSIQQGTAELLSAVASLPLQWHGGPHEPTYPTGLIVEGSFVELHANQAPLGPFIEWNPSVVHAGGSITGNVRVDSPIGSAPRARGDISLEDGYLEFVGLGQQLTQATGRVVFHPGWLEIEEFEAHDGEGRTRISGGISLDGLTPTNARLALYANRFPIRSEGIALATLTAGGRLQADIGENETTASLVVSGTTIALPEQSAGSVQALAPHPDITLTDTGLLAAATEDSGTPQVYRIHLTASDAVWVRRKDFAAQASPDLQLVYDDPDFLVSGYINLRRGFFEVFGKRFDVERGTLNFNGERELNPNVDLVAIHKLRGGDSTVTINVSGTLTDPQIRFASTHPDATDEGSIIALLVSGRAGLDRPADTSTAGASDQAVNFLAGLTAGLLTLSAREQLGGMLPVIVLESGDQGFRSARARVGFQADRIIPAFLRPFVVGAYFEGFIEGGASSDTREGPQGRAAAEGGFLVEFEFPHNIVITFTYEVPSSGGVDVTWQP